MATDKTRETRLRRMAERQGLRLERSRRRDPRAIGYGTYRLADPNGNVAVAADRLSGYGMDLDTIETWLTRDYYLDIDIPGAEGLGPADSSPLHLIGQLVLVLDKAERQGLPWPDYNVVAEDDDGHRRKLNASEQKAWDTACENALAALRSRRLISGGGA